jgi:imidazolonepropionase-like amidohydrolase
MVASPKLARRAADLILVNDRGPSRERRLKAIEYVIKEGKIYEPLNKKHHVGLQ